ncbi:MAG: hypothetical protein HXY41_17180 [Chloroflexi bacterium]|nr:hypothetical protein [Chloroflexota bacterium]
MTRFLLILIALLVAVFTALVAVVPPLAGASAAAAVAQTDDCHLPCWKGIIPGETTFNQALQILDDQGFQKLPNLDTINLPGQYFYIAAQPTDICQVGLTNTRALEAIVREVSLWFCQPQKLGDLMMLVDAPSTILPLTSLLVYSEGRIVFILSQPFCSDRLSPYSAIRYISLTDDKFNQPLFSQTAKLPWRGFSPPWRYEWLFGEVC